jgi:hypothetical protein
MTQWYYDNQGQRRGPVGEEELVSLIRAGDVQQSDLAWTRGMPHWVPVANISALARASEPEEEAPVVVAPPPSFWARRKAGLKLSDLEIKKEWAWRIVVLAGALLLLLSFMLPWWGIRKRGSLDNDQSKNVARVATRNKAWYDEHGIARIELTRSVDKWLWGPETASGVIGLIVALAMAPLTIVPIAVKSAQPWGWIGSLITAVLGLVLVILAMLWVFLSPGEDVPPIFYQGMLAGPYVYLLASLLILVGGVTEGGLGLWAFLKSRKTVLPPAT